ncbi:MAG: hypothetical protein ACI4RC_06340 [Oscillospiraceae bacterium]
MADKFSLDDILEEYSKRSSNTENKDKAADKKANSDDRKLSDKENTKVQPDLHSANKSANNEGADEKSEVPGESKHSQHVDSIMKKRRKLNTAKSQPVTPVNRPNVKDIDMGLEGKVIPKTAEFDKAVEIPADASEEEKARIIYEKRQKKIDSFRLKTKERSDSSKESESEENSGGQKEFESFDQSTEIMQDIVQVKNNLVMRLIVLAVTFLFSLIVTLGNDLGLTIVRTFDKAINPAAYVFTNTILGIISIGVSYTVLLAGIKNLFKKKADCDSLSGLGIFVSTIIGIVMLFKPEVIQNGFFHMYMSVSIAGLVFNTLGKLLIVKRAERNFSFAVGEYDRYGVVNVNDEDVAGKFTRGMLNDFPELATMRKTEFIKDFMKNSYSSDIADRFAGKATPIICIAALVVGILSLFFDRHAAGLIPKLFVMLAAFSGTISIGSSLALMLVVNLPLANASKKYLRYSAVMLGYSSVEEFADTNSVLVDAEDLFPNGMVDLVNLKLFSSTPIEECILMAASLSCQANSILSPTFYKMLRGKTEMLYPVESYIYEDGLGLCGWIQNKRVLFGTRELMENHSIDGLPTLAKEAEYSKGNIVVYLSISGVVSTLFVIRANASLSVSRWLQQLEQEDIRIIVKTSDGFINQTFLAELFDILPSSVKMLSFRYHKEYEKQTEYQPSVSASMICSGHFPSFAMLIIGAKRLKLISSLGIAIQFGSTVLGIVLALIMMITGAFSQITPTLILIYQLIFALATYLVQKIKKP